MKRRYFANHQEPEKLRFGNILSVALILISLYLIFYGWPHWFFVLVFFLIMTYAALYGDPLYRYRNHVYYDNKKITMHLNSFTGKTVKFKSIKTFSFGEEYLEFEYFGGSIQNFCIKNIYHEDLNKLRDILINHT